MNLIPETLRRAHEDRKVVFFCGAGVSMPALPSFKGLVKLVLADLLPAEAFCEPGSTEALAWKAFDKVRYDEALDILENPRSGGYEPKNVRDRVRYHLTKPKIKSLDQHLILARLANLDKDFGLLVTTNFDSLFEKAQTKLRRIEKSRYKMAVHIAPSLPPAKPDTSHGLIHLHGKLGSSSDDRRLVLTLTDFGTAYMLEGWARRFVVELFRRYHVVFIGYRAEDPTMRYLVSALAASRGVMQFQEAFAFAPFGENDENPISRNEAEQEWLLKGLTPLAYEAVGEDHRHLWEELRNWADDHRQGVLGRRQMVARLGKFPPTGENDPAIPELVWALKDESVAKHFADLAGEDRPNPDWLIPLQKAGLLSLPIGETAENVAIEVPLISRVLPDHFRVNKATFHLGRWIASCLDNTAVLNLVLTEGGVLHRELRWHIQHRLKDTESGLPLALRKIWRVLADDGYAHALSVKGMNAFTNYPRMGPINAFANRIFLERLRPIPVFRVSTLFFDEQREPDAERTKDWYETDIALIGIKSDHDIDQFRDNAEDWERSIAVIADDITTRLTEALDWLREFDSASSKNDPTYLEYRSISAHEQNKYAPTWTQLIALARDSYNALVATGDTATATRLARRWQSLPYPVFRRLALYAATAGRDA